MPSRDLRVRYSLLLLRSLAPLGSTAAPDADEQGPAAREAAISVRGDGADVQQGTLRMSIDALGDDLLHVRIAPAGVYPEDASWSVPAALRARRGNVEPSTERRPAGSTT